MSLTLSVIFRNVDFLLNFIFLCIQTICYYIQYPFEDLLAAYSLESAVPIFKSDKNKRNKIKRLSTVLITGAAGGLGRELAINFAEKGSMVILCDIDESRLNETYQALKKSYGSENILSALVDLANLSSIKKMASNVRQMLKQMNVVPFVTCLVNNAVSPINSTTVLDADLSTIEKQFKVNVLAHYALYKEFIPDMLTHNCGHIVSINSVLNDYNQAMLSGYVITKSAASKLHQSLRLEIKSNMLMTADKISMCDNSTQVSCDDNDEIDHSNIKTTIVFPYHLNTKLFEDFEAKANLFFPVLSFKNTAKQIVDAVVNAEEEVFIPRQFSILRIMKIIMPAYVFDQLLQITTNNKRNVN